MIQLCRRDGGISRDDDTSILTCVISLRSALRPVEPRRVLIRRRSQCSVLL
jgi:hypothetical protein